MKDKQKQELLRQLQANRTELRNLLDDIGVLIDEQHQHANATNDVAEMQRLENANPIRWHEDAKHSLQAGLMFAERAITQTENF